MTKPQSFSDRLAQERRHKAVRDCRDVLKKDVAKAIGTSESSVGRWESGANMPDEDMIERLARYFGVTPAWLRYGQPPRDVEEIPTLSVEPLVPVARSAVRSAKGRKRG